MDKEAAEAWKRSLVLFNEKEAADAAGQAFDHGGLTGLLEWDLNWNKQKAARQYISPMDFANDFGLLKRKEETLRYLEEAYRERAPFMIHIQCNPNFDFLHAEPHYRAIVKKWILPRRFEDEHREEAHATAVFRKHPQPNRMLEGGAYVRINPSGPKQRLYRLDAVCQGWLVQKSPFHSKCPARGYLSLNASSSPRRNM